MAPQYRPIEAYLILENAAPALDRNTSKNTSLIAILQYSLVQPDLLSTILSSRITSVLITYPAELNGPRWRTVADLHVYLCSTRLLTRRFPTVTIIVSSQYGYLVYPFIFMWRHFCSNYSSYATNVCVLVKP